MQAKAVLDADVVVFHRPNDHRSKDIALHLRSVGKKIVMDNDDTYKGIDTQKLGLKFKQVDQAVDDFVKIADMVTCSTEYLAQEYRKINPNVVVLPNCVDPLDWPEPERNEGEKVRIGFVGSVALNNDFDEFKPTLMELNKRSDVQLVLFSLPPKIPATEQMVQKLYKDDYEFWLNLNVEWQPFVMMEDYAETLNNLKLDIMVIPRKDDYFNRCKSNIKFLESSMLEIPVVAQGFEDGNSPYQSDPDDASHMSVVVDNSKWMEALDPLIADREKRRTMGKIAREYVLNKYDIALNISKWERAYESLLNA
jgi:glycosyltransferase involved in cell wall biosynthesis